MFTGLTADLRYTIRTLAKSRGFVGVAVLSLAIGIGANTAIFSVIRHLLLDPLPVPRPHELALVAWSEPASISISQINSGAYRDPATGAFYRTNFNDGLSRSLAATVRHRAVLVSAFNYVRDVSVAAEGRPAILTGGLLADASYFRTLELAMAIGRAFTEVDDKAGAPPVAVLSYAFWQRAFAGDPSVLGRIVRINGSVFDVIGVTSRGFRGLSRGGSYPETDVTMPLAAQPLIVPRWAPRGGSLATADDVYWLRLLARVPSEVDREEIAATMTPVLRGWLPAEARSGGRPPVIHLVPGDRGEPSVKPEGARVLMLLGAVVGVVLLVTCVNLAALMLARGVSRQRELDVRRALGATRLRLVRQLLLEGIVLAMMGAAGGILVSAWSRRVLSTLLTASLGSGFDGVANVVDVDVRMLMMTLGFALVAAMLFSLLPALRLSRVQASAHLKHRAAGEATPRLTLGRSLIAIQISVSVPLVVGAALFLRTLWNLAAVDVGFEPRGLAMFRVIPEAANVPETEHARLYLDVLRQTETVPGVVSATLIENPLMSGLTSSNRITLEDGRSPSILMNAVGPAFFETTGMRLVAGRAPAPSDDAGSAHVAVVNEAAVRELFGGASPIGRRVRVGRRDIEIIGIVSDSRYSRQRADVRPILFDSALQRRGFGGHYVLFRATAPIGRLEAEIRRAVEAVHRNVPVEIRTQVSLMEATRARERVFAQLLTIFGSFALLLSAIGLHGVTSYAVARRTSEIGVRIALGAPRSQVLWLILRQVVALSATGLAIGVPIAVAAGPVVGSLLFGVAPTDAPMIVSAAAVMFLVAIIAGLLPASRAARLDPLVALRAE